MSGHKFEVIENGFNIDKKDIFIDLNTYLMGLVEIDHSVLYNAHTHTKKPKHI